MSYVELLLLVNFRLNLSQNEQSDQAAQSDTTGTPEGVREQAKYKESRVTRRMSTNQG
jgi:hypothetical protein